MRLQKLRLEELNAKMEEKISLHWDCVIADNHFLISESQTDIAHLGYEIEQTRSTLTRLQREHIKADVERQKRIKAHIDKGNKPKRGSDTRTIN